MADIENQIEPTLDSQVLPLLPLKNKMLFPKVMMQLMVTRPKAITLVQQMYQEKATFAVFCQKSADASDLQLDDLYPFGVTAQIDTLSPVNSKMVQVVLKGIDIAHLNEIQAVEPYYQARVTVDADNTLYPLIDADPQFKEQVEQARATAVRILSKTNHADLIPPLNVLTIPTLIVNYIAATYPMHLDERQKYLEISDLRERATRLLDFLKNEEQSLSIKQEINQITQEEVDKSQREYYLQQQMHAIQRELGDTTEADVNNLRERAKQMRWNEQVAAVFESEVKKLERMGLRSPEYPGQLNYLEVMLSLPWNIYTADNLDIRNAQTILDEDHFGMEDVKERILEHLAVLRQLQSTTVKRTPILCLYGPPGVGKTSLGKSIAKALGRKYARISLGGLHDEAEIRGHRKTYIGAMPGRIIDSLQKVHSSNPVFVLDEIDKITSDFHGDPTSALLEVLDPEQNNAFHDNYLDVDYDLSKVLFIATANSLQSIPRPLLDRMELIEMTGYLQEEKEQICLRHLVPKELEMHGLSPTDLSFSLPAIRSLIDDYTRESGVRELDRQVQSVIRKWVKQHAMGESVPATIEPDDVRHYLGKPRYTRDRYETNEYTGVVTGLAWTQVGGEILFIETSLSNAKSPTLTLTGNLGDVMKESATIALGYIRAHAADFGIQQKLLDTKSVHLHVPEGAIPKDGPSAGITMTTAMVSAFTGRKVRERLAMTGEMTLRGRVLPVGGIKEKILAAKRAGITDIILCYENEKDVQEIKEEYVRGVSFHYVRDIREVVDFALL